MTAASLNGTTPHSRLRSITTRRRPTRPSGVPQVGLNSGQDEVARAIRAALRQANRPLTADEIRGAIGLDDGGREAEFWFWFCLVNTLENCDISTTVGGYFGLNA